MSSYAAQPVRPDLNIAAKSVDTELTDVFLADHFFPAFDAPVSNAVFESYGVEVDTQLPAGDGKRAKGDDFDQVGYAKGKDQFDTQEYGYKGVIDRASEMNTERFSREEQKVAQRLRRIVLAKREERVAGLTVNNAAFAGGTNFGTTVGAVWSGAGTPISDLIAAAESIYNECGFWPNVLGLTKKQYFELSMNTETAGRLNTTVDNGAFIELPRLSALLQIDNIIIGNVPYNTAPDGAEAVMGRIWPNSKIFMGYTRSDDALEEVQFGRTIAFDEGLGGGMGQTVSWGEHPRMQEYANFMTVQEKIRVMECGHVLHGVL